MRGLAGSEMAIFEAYTGSAQISVENGWFTGAEEYNTSGWAGWIRLDVGDDRHCGFGRRAGETRAGDERMSWMSLALR